MLNLSRLLYNLQMPSDGGMSDGGFGGGNDGIGDSSGYGDYGGFAGGGSASGITNNEQNVGMGAGVGQAGDGSQGDNYGADSNPFGVDVLNPSHLNAVVSGLGMSTQGTAFDGYANMGFMAGTSFEQNINGTNYGYDFGKDTFSENQVTSGYLDFNFDKMYAKTYGQSTATIQGGTIASHLLGLGLTPTESITGEAISKVAIGILLGASSASIGLSAIQGLSQVMGVAGVMTKEEYNNVNMAIGVASATLGLMHTMQTISAVTSSFGYMSTTQKALAIAVTALSTKNNINSFREIDEKYGIDPGSINITDITDINFTEDGLLNNYEKLIKIQSDNQNPTYGTKPNEWQTIDRMAGSVLFDMFMAGGNFNATQDFSQLKASVGGKYILSNYAKQSTLQEDFLSQIDSFTQLNKIYEPNSYIDNQIINTI